MKRPMAQSTPQLDPRPHQDALPPSKEGGARSVEAPSSHEPGLFAFDARSPVVDAMLDRLQRPYQSPLLREVVTEVGELLRITEGERALREDDMRKASEMIRRGDLAGALAQLAW